MRLGVVGMLPGDFRAFEPAHLGRVRELGFTGAGFHFSGDRVAEVRPSDTEQCRLLFADGGLDLVQFSVSYSECLFHPDSEVRNAGVRKIQAGAEMAAGLGARFFLIRPGSLNERGSWTPHRDNHTSGAWDRLIRTVEEVMPVLEQTGVIAVMETHLVSILRNPEASRRMVECVGSPNLRLVMDYVNHFETLDQVYDSAGRLDRIFSEMGAYAPVMHVKDIAVGSGLVLHLNETVPGNGELDLAHGFRCFQGLFPEEYGLIEHLKPALIPEAASNARAIASRAGVPILPGFSE